MPTNEQVRAAIEARKKAQQQSNQGMAGQTVQLSGGQNYTMQGASQGGQPFPEQPKPTTPSVPVEKPKTTAVAPMQPLSTSQPAQSVSTQPSPTQPSIDREALKNAGVPDSLVDEMMLKLQPQQQALNKVAADQRVLLDETTSSLNTEQKETEALLNSVKERKQQLYEQEQQLTDLSAETQKGIAEQEYQKSKFLNEQAKAQFELEMTQAERKQSIDNEERETALRRALGAQLGANFSGRGIEMSLNEKRRGEELLSDLRAKTAIGKAEFSFRAIDIEKGYSNALKQIETERKTQSIQNLTRLDDELTAIDQQVLLTRQQKAEAARKAMKDFYDKQEEIDMKSGALVSSAVNEVFEKKKELEQEKLEREAFNLEQSRALGYFANKYGEPIGVAEGQPPKPFIGEYNEALSKQFGYLVDDQGRAIKGSNGQNIQYKDPDLISFQNALSAFQGGDYSEGTKSALNFRLGTNNVIATTLKNGVSYPSPKYGKLQCGEYINDQFLASRQLGSDYANANALIEQYGGKPGSFAPQVGDIVFMNTGDPNIPHKAIVEGMDEQGNLILTDANYVGPGVVRHGWKITQGDGNWKKIHGFARLPLKANVGLAQPALTPNIGGTDNRSGNPLLDNIVVSYEDYKKLGIEEKRVLAAKGYTEEAVRNYFESNTPEGGTLDLETTQKIIKDDKWKKAEALKTYKRAIENFNNATANITDFQVLGKNRPILESAWNDLAIAYKNKAELGALAGPDLQLVEGVAQKVGVGNLTSGLGFNAFLETLETQGKGGVDAIKQANQINLANVNKELGEVRDDVIGRYPLIQGTNLEAELMKNYTPLSVEEYNLENLTPEEQLESAGIVGDAYKNVSGTVKATQDTLGNLGGNLNNLFSNLTAKSTEVSQQAGQLAGQAFKNTQEALSFIQNSPEYRDSYSKLEKSAPKIIQALQGYSPENVKKFFLSEQYKSLL